MRSFEQRIAAYAATSANLITLLKELEQLRERVRETRLSRGRPARLKQRPDGPRWRPSRIVLRRHKSLVTPPA